MTGMIDFEFAFRYAEAKQTALQKAAGCIPAGRCVVLCGDMKLLRQSVATRGAFAAPWEKLRALPAYLEILTVPMALRVIRIAETLSAFAETRGIDLKRRKSNFLSLRFSALDAVFAAVLLAAIAAGLLL